IVAWDDPLRLSHFLGQRERFTKGPLRLVKMTLRLMDLRDHDERYGEMIELSQLAVQRGRCVRGLETFGFTMIRERTIRRRQIGVDIRLVRGGAYLCRQLEAGERHLNCPR